MATATKTPTKASAKTTKSPVLGAKKSPFKPAQTASNLRANGQAKAEAFGNCDVSIGGTAHRLPKGIPLDSTSSTQAFIIKKAKEHFEKTGEMLTINLRCTIKLVNEEVVFDETADFD